MSIYMRRITDIVVHTAASAITLCPTCGTRLKEGVSCAKHGKSEIRVIYARVQDIDHGHRVDRHFDMIGYHEYIGEQGELSMGRPEWLVGAGVGGSNPGKFHICLAGHGDYAPLTEGQLRTLLERLRHHKNRNPGAAVKGHREYLEIGKPGYKSCPGQLVSMDEIRRKLG